MNATARGSIMPVVVALLGLHACSSPEPCWTAEVRGPVPHDDTGRMEVAIESWVPGYNVCPGHLEGAHGERFFVLGASTAADSAVGPWRLSLHVDGDEQSTDPRRPLWSFALTVRGVTGPGDQVLGPEQLKTSVTCSGWDAKGPLPVLTGTLHLERWSADCNDARARGEPEDACALDAAGTLTVQGADAAGNVVLRTSARFDVAQSLVCPPEITGPADHK